MPLRAKEKAQGDGDRELTRLRCANRSWPLTGAICPSGRLQRAWGLHRRMSISCCNRVTTAQGVTRPDPLRSTAPVAAETTPFEVFATPPIVSDTEVVPADV